MVVLTKLISHQHMVAIVRYISMHIKLYNIFSQSDLDNHSRSQHGVQPHFFSPEKAD